MGSAAEHRARRFGERVVGAAAAATRVWAVVEAFRANGLDYPRATVFTISPEARISLVATGRFLSIVPTSILRFPKRRPEINVLPVKLSIARVPFGIITLRNRTLSPVAQLFIEHAREVAKPLAIRKS